MHVSRRTILAGATAGAAGVIMGPGRAVRADDDGRDVLAITHVTVIDAAGVRRDQNVLLRGDRILDAGDLRRVPVPRGARWIDGAGKFLIPGIADMHSHATTLADTDPELSIVNGVTTVRQMAHSVQVDGWRRAIDAGTRLGPRWTMGSQLIDGAPSLWEGLGAPFRSVANAGEARSAVRAEHQAGADFIKTYTRLSRESFLAIADESDRLGIPFLGHVPDFVQLTEASDAGLRTAEHLFEIWYDTSADERRIRQGVTGVSLGPSVYNGWFNLMHPWEYAAARSYDPRKAERVFQRLVRNQTWVTPTLVMHQTLDTPQDIDLADPRFRYFSAQTIGYWQWTLQNIYLNGRTAEQSAQRRELFQRRLDLVGALAEAGVPLMTGTDVGTTYLMPGFSVHDEMAMLVRAGLRPLEALRAATLEPARYLGRPDQGTVTRGNVADLVLLNADPLQDIRNTTRIDSVIARGRLVDADERRQMLAAIETTAQIPASVTAGAATAARVTGCLCHSLTPGSAAPVA